MEHLLIGDDTYLDMEVGMLFFWAADDKSEIYVFERKTYGIGSDGVVYFEFSKCELNQREKGSFGKERLESVASSSSSYNSFFSKRSNLSPRQIWICQKKNVFFFFHPISTTLSQLFFSQVKSNDTFTPFFKQMCH